MITTQEYLQFAKNILREKYGIKDLNNIELFHLRKTIESSLCMYNEHVALLKIGRLRAESIPEVEEEAVERWLYDLYGIRDKDCIDKIKIEYEYRNGIDRTLLFEICEKDKAEAIFERLRKRFGRVKEYRDILSDEAKEYIARIRERATWLERQ